jgi:hypothetical protein
MREPERKMPGCQWVNGRWMPKPARPALWEYGEEITLRIEGDGVVVGNGIDILAVFDLG